MLAAAWHPVALADDIAPGTGNGTRIDGREIAVWRDLEGSVHVWDDRCPHRGMRLSFGFIRGSEIACLYHGWRYDAAGRCRYIPAHPQLAPPDTIKAEVHDAVERLGIVWMRGGESGPPPDERPVTPVRSITVACPPAVAARKLLGAGNGTGDRLGPFSIAPVAGGEEIMIGIQPLSEKASVFHMAIAGSHPNYARKRASAWAEALRGELEAAANARAGSRA